MLSESLQRTKTDVIDTLTSKGLGDSFARQLLAAIEPNSNVMAFCHKCKELDKIDFVQFDGNLMMHCCNCNIDIMDLETELYSFIHFNVIKKRGEKFE